MVRTREGERYAEVLEIEGDRDKRGGVVPARTRADALARTAVNAYGEGAVFVPGRQLASDHYCCDGEVITGDGRRIRVRVYAE